MRFRLASLLFISFWAHQAVAQGKVDKLDSLAEVTKSPYKNSFLPIPLVALSTETSWVFGIATAYTFKTVKLDPILRTSTMTAGFLYTLKDQIIIGLGGYIFLPKEKYILRFENTFSKFPDKFWGIGNETPENAVESYTFTQYFINPNISKKIAKDLFLGVGFDLQNVFNIRYDSGGNFEQDQVTGIYNRTKYFTFGFTGIIQYDSRKHTYVPKQGSLVRLKFSHFNQRTGSDYDFHTFDIDARKYVEIKPRGVLAFQAFGLFGFGDVPYRNLASLGGSQMMRGYYGGRYRDKMYITTQAEYRFPVYWRFGAAVFASAGQVANNFSQFSFSKFHYAAGAGVRFSVLPREKLNLRFDMAYGNKLNFYILLAESF